jgi:5'(3')-deoxyribonucleotidase
MIDCILLDMDGVIADFVSASLEVAKIPLTHDEVNMWDYYKPYMTEKEFWTSIDTEPEFWRNIKPYPWAKRIVELCRSIAPTYFCSSPSQHHVSASDKILWLRTHGFMEHDKNDYLLTSHKWMAAGPGRILIDDSTHNVDSFNARGGLGLTFPQPWNEGRCIAAEDRRVDFIQVSLKKINERAQVSQQKFSSILAEADRLTGHDRQTDYGPPDEDFRRTAGMWTAMLAHKLKDGQKFESWEVAQLMICIKLSRLQHARKRDNVVDTAGYANCMDACYQADGGYSK